MKRERAKKTFALLAVVSLLIFSSLFGEASAAQKAKPRKAQAVKTRNAVVELHGIEPLKEAFQRDKGKIRLVTILSPT
jgi:hypothetical protein